MSTLREAEAQRKAGQVDAARAGFERAEAMFPEYTGADAPQLALARLYRERGDRRAAAAALARYTALDERPRTPTPKSRLEGRAGRSGRRRPGARAHALDLALRRRAAREAAGLAEQLRDFPGRWERRAALRRHRPIRWRRYQLARTLALRRQRGAAEILQCSSRRRASRRRKRCYAAERASAVKRSGLRLWAMELSVVRGSRRRADA
jgi:hypothetical protein